MAFRRSETSITDLLEIQPDVFGDTRGFFAELYNHRHFDSIGLGHLSFVQDNLSLSRKGTIRGLHFQAPPFDQGKLVSVLQGKALDVAVDIRKGSPTYGHAVAVELSAEKLNMLFVPPGFAHGFQVLSESCLFSYKCTNFYDKASEGGLMWNDPALDIPWVEDIEPILSEKDQYYPTFKEFVSPFSLETEAL
ncbi:MAG: dTDP-4-dehydrorhamnose 3,5-epimerase [Bacteroidota bacterium]